MKTSYGLEFKLTDKIDEGWSPYDKTIADIHLSRFKTIIVDIFGCPIDNEFDLDEIEKQL